MYAFGTSRNHGVVTDITELVDACVPSDVHVVADVDVSSNSRVTGDDDVVTDHAIVSDVRVGEENVVISEDGPFAFLGARVNARVFAENIFGSYLETRFAGTSFKVLGATTNQCIREDFAVRSQLSESFDGGVVMNGATIGEGDIGTDECVGTNSNVLADFRA